MPDYTTIKLKRSSERNKKPAVADLEYGELALNYQNGKLYLKINDSDGISIVEIQNFNKDVQFFSNVTLGDALTDQIIVNGNADFNNGIDVVGNTILENTAVKGSLSVDSDLNVLGKGQIGFVVIDSDTVTSSSGDLKLNGSSGYVNVLNDLIVGGDFVVDGGFSAGASGITLPAGAVTLGTQTNGAYVRNISSGNGISISQTNPDSESNDVIVSLGSLKLPDNVDLSFGNESDMAIYHDGTNSVITNKFGDLVVENNDIVGDTWKLIFDRANDRVLFNRSGTNLMELDSVGNLTVVGNLVGNGTIT